MKRIITFCLILTTSLCICGCSMLPGMGNSIQIKEMREIADLATVECYFHNVAKSDKDLNPTWYEFWKKKNMMFWVEYDGIVKIGIDVSKLKVSVEDNTVNITLPEAIVLEATVNPDTLTNESFYYNPDSERPNVDEQSEAFKGAQQDMIASAEANDTLKENARDNAKELLENYVKTIGDATGVDYTINWIYLENEE